MYRPSLGLALRKIRVANSSISPSHLLQQPSSRFLSAPHPISRISPQQTNQFPTSSASIIGGGSSRRITTSSAFRKQILGEPSSEKVKRTTTANMIKAECSEFPEAALLPKHETGVTGFIAKNPTFDGRGVVIAIFDSGVDPRAAGLQRTSDGKPKVIHMMDGSGAGDVDTKTQVEVENGFITGISGRKLKIPSTWKNPSGKYRIGLKTAYELYPSELKERMRKSYEEKHWNSQLQPTMAEVTRILQKFEAEHTGELNAEDKQYKEELEARVDILSKLDKNYVDLGPTYDCVLWHDGESWKAVVDITCEGNLEECEVVGPYSETQQCSVLNKEDNLTYCINVHDEGDILEIVSIACAHGTHVASIATAYFPDNPLRNGIAPGAQVVSIRLSDTRVGTMETGTALYRAMAACMKLDVDVINMSYGESSKWSYGRVWCHLEEMINKKGITMLVSAGNAGPALSTLGTPPTPSAIGVGAMVTPPMMEAEYSLREKIPAIGYNWTSRGPSIDGRLGPSICAPGAAITSVPTYLLQSSELMNGTSMASPNAAGVVCLLVSALKQSNILYSPYSLRRSLENSALKTPSYEPFANGQGLIQVDKAWEWLQAVRNDKENLMRFDIRTDTRRRRGIYLRELAETQMPQIKTVQILPGFVDEDNAAHDLKTSYEQNFSLACDASWIQIPAVLHMMYQDRNFAVKVDPRSLEEGQVHYSEIEAYECGKPNKGPVFRIPVTVVKPKILPKDSTVLSQTVCLKPGVPNRTFIAAPSGATWCLIKMRSNDAVNASSVYLHTLQFQEDSSYPDNDFTKMATLQPLGEAAYPVRIRSGRTLEVCLSKWWSSFGDLSLSWSIQFFGLKPNGESFQMSSGDGLGRFDVVSSLGPEDILPQISLKQHVIVLKPTKTKITPGGTRDVIPEGRVVYSNNLTYNLNLQKGGECVIGLPYMCNYLYENEFDSQLWMVFDQNKQLMGCGDAFPERYPVKLEKGEYTVIVQVRHTLRTFLERVSSDFPLQVKVKLVSPLSLDIYSLPDQALQQGKKATSSILMNGHEKAFYVGHLTADRLPKGSQAGHFLQGSLTLTTDEVGKKVATYPFRYYLSEMSSKKKADKENKENKEDKKTPDEEFEEASCDFCSQQLAKGSEKAEDLYQKLIQKNPKANQLILAKIQSLLKLETDDKSKEETNLKQVVQLADDVLNNVNPEKLLLSLGCRQDKSEVAANKELDKQKQLVIDVLCKKGEALTRQLALNETSDPELKPSIESVYTELQKFVDPLQDVKTVSFVEKYLKMKKYYGKLAKLLVKVQEDKPTIETEKKLIEAYKLLEWNHCMAHSERSRLVRFPPEYRPF